MADRSDAEALDAADPLGASRDRFVIPRAPGGADALYLCGNSLGLQPTAARAEVEAVLADWGNLAVDGHFDGDPSWYRYDEPIAAAMADLVGARIHEVAAAGTLTANLHLLLASFYRPRGPRRRIVIEYDAFPSDRYAVQSQLAWHGHDPERDLVELAGDDDLGELLDRHAGQIALVLLGGVNYLTGELLDLGAMASSCAARDVVFGLDLAHAAGNVELALHDWGVDFAAWCTYKYLNAGPGSVAGLFVHERHGLDAATPRLAGWWGNDPQRRFDMDVERVFVPRPGADGWKVSNPSILALAPLRASLREFQAAGGMGPLRVKSRQLTAYLCELLTDIDGVEVITPGPERRGCQISLRLGDARATQTELHARGVVVDFRPPDVIRLAPTPLYNRFTDVWDAVEALRSALR